MGCPYVVWEVQNGLPSYLARINEELTECLCDTWDLSYIEHSKQGAEKYVETMQKPGRKLWIG